MVNLSGPPSAPPAAGGENASLSIVVSWLQYITQALNGINQTLTKVFPQTTGTATSATGGSATLPADPVGFLTVINPATGITVKIPYYSD